MATHPFFAAAMFTFSLLGTPFYTPPAQAQTPVRNPTNKHYYSLIVSPTPLSWHEAEADARNSAFKGMVGYLATITSAQEEAFLEDSVYRPASLPSDYGVWLGAYRAPTSTVATVGWRWVTGEPWRYTHWRTGEPNNAGDQEHRLCLDSTLVWNDMANDPTHGLGQFPVRAYIIEYGIVVIPAPPKKPNRITTPRATRKPQP